MNNKNRYYHYLNEANDINKNKINHYNEMDSEDWAIAIGTVLFLNQWAKNIEDSNDEERKVSRASSGYPSKYRSRFPPEYVPTPPPKTVTRKAVKYIVDFIMDDLKNNQNIKSINIDEKIKNIRDATIDFIVKKEKEHNTRSFIGKAILVIKNFFTDNLDDVIKKIYDILIDKNKEIHEKYTSFKMNNINDNQINAKLNVFIYNKFEENEIDHNSVSKITQAWRKINLNSNKVIAKESK